MSLPTLSTQLTSGARLRILFINDVGFQYGAGIATLRQIQSFLVMGHEVMGICFAQGPIEASIPLKPLGAVGIWHGMAVLSYLHPSCGVSQDRIVETLVWEAKRRSPDVIVLGNLHGAQWPLSLASALQTLGRPVIVFMHDCYLISGRCAYPGDCTRYEVGCNAACPTWEEYPSLPPEQIFGQWVLRRQIFCGSQGVPIAANSYWTLGMAKRALKGLTHIDCLYCGLDANLFRPIDKTFARRLLGLPEDAFIVLGGCANINDYRKGGHIFNQIAPRLRDRAHFLVFGANSKGLAGVQGTGLVRDYRRMPLIFNAADGFVGASLEEAFGQTFCEASACGIPVVAFPVGGIPEIARHDLNARLASDISADAMIEEIEFFRKQPEARQTFGQAGRTLVEEEFTLYRQGERWLNYLSTLKGMRPGQERTMNELIAKNFRSLR